MICLNCRTINDDDDTYCISCGTKMKNTGNNSEFNTSSDVNTSQQYNTTNSKETEVFNRPQPNQSNPNFNPVNPYSGNYPVHPKQKNWFLIVGIPIILLLVIGGGYFYLSTKNEVKEVKTETLPEHFGLFSQNSDNTELSEVKKLDVTNAVEAKDKLLEDGNLPKLNSQPNWILYSEEGDVPLSELKLIEIKSIKDDGSINQIEFEAAPVKDKSEMKKIRLKKGLATGKYAFALFDGYLDDGKHRFWAFEVKSGTKSDNGDLVQNTNISTKPKEKATPPPEVPPPSGARVAYVTENSVVMRSGPSQASSPLGKFSRGQKIYVIEFSSNQESFRNYYTNFARVQTTSGRTGWIYAAFIRLG